MSVTEITASAVPSVPRTISATQRLAALNVAREIEEYRKTVTLPPYAKKLLDDSYLILMELAGDAKGDK